MRPESSLRRRLIAACVLLATVIGGVFASATYVIVEAVEYELIDVRLERAADLLIRAHRQGFAIPPYPDVRLLVGAQMPGEMSALTTGRHEIKLEGREYYVLVVNEDGERYALVDDVTDFERLELISFAGLCIAFFSGVMLALAIARASASRIIAPLTALSEAVQRNELAMRPELLSATDEIGVLARAFDARASELQQFLVRERLFTADVSHELRTPLTIILGASELLGTRLAERPELQAIAERIRRTSAEASVQVSALLHLARSASASASEALPLRRLIRHEIERSSLLLAGKPVTIELDAPCEVCVSAHPNLAAIAIGNLLRNACHFTERGSIRVVLTEDSIIIEDTGRGVPDAVRRRLFEPFVRGSDEPSTGSGLGLSIVKRIAGHLGWGIRLDDAPRGGSRFTLIFASHAALTRS